MIKSIVFDMDDTLYDEIDYYKSGFKVVSRTIASDFGLNETKVSDTLWKIFDCGNHKNAFDETAKNFGITFDDNYIAKLIDIFRNHKPDISLPAESRQVLTELRKKFKLGLITDGWLPAQEYKVRALQLENYLDCIIYTEKLGPENWKPSPKSFEMILSNFGIEACETVYVGDNLRKDFIAPNKMGFKTILISRQNRIHSESAPSQDAAAQYEINSISEIVNLLKKIDGL
ncbi:MAG: Pyrimidine 5'-nucleotidase YjjG [Planctomycetes bacterium ADurb.Bin401]|nr:MAG: Pyrimidine 5'-nucleotidase YjjG [Planctomycetes bacterium ADurb.Bin401]